MAFLKWRVARHFGPQFRNILCVIKHVCQFLLLLLGSLTAAKPDRDPHLGTAGNWSLFPLSQERECPKAPLLT
eukprot:7322436-Alexandrium_andersonii.AAC.1